MVTYSDLFQFVIMFAAVITLVYNCKKVTAHKDQL